MGASRKGCPPFDALTQAKGGIMGIAQRLTDKYGNDRMNQIRVWTMNVVYASIVAGLIYGLVIAHIW